jgi:hypothetical protein
MKNNINIKNAAFWTVCTIAVGTLCAPSGRAELVTNGGFGTGDLTGWTCPQADCSNAGLSQDPYWSQVSTLFPHAGTYGLLMGASDTTGATYPVVTNPISDPSSQGAIEMTISQNLTTVVGQTYLLQFSYGEYNNNPTMSTDPQGDPCGLGGCYLDPGNVDYADPTSSYYQYNYLGVLVGGASVYSDQDFLAAPQGLTQQGQGFYQTEDIAFTATSTSTSLAFEAYDVQADVALDSISVTATPEPGTMGLLASAFLGLGLLARRRGFFARG